MGNKKITSELYRPAIRLIIALIILGVIAYVIGVLPMLSELRVPHTPISAANIINAVIYVVMIVIILNFGREITPTVREYLPKFPEAATALMLILVLVVISIAYSAFKWVSYFFRDFSWIYALLFLLIAIIPLYRLGMLLYTNIDKLTDLLTGKIAEVSGELRRCPNCEEMNPSDSKFCKKCGAALTPTTEAKPKTKTCPNCNATLPDDAKFCSECGTRL